jgi:hypothetical protein
VDAATVFEPVDGANVRVVERRQEPGLTLKPRETIGVRDEDCRQHFYRDVAIELRIARAIHLTHAARAERGDDFVRPEFRSRCQAHFLFSSASQFATTLIGVRFDSSSN